MSDNSKVWAEKYRPQFFEDCVLPASTKKQIKDAIDSGNLQHMLFAGTAGTGKTSLARAIANTLDADLLYINCSLNSSIDNIRSDVVSFSSSVSLSGGSKIVLLDEIDGMSASAMNSLKGVVEEFSNTRFFATTNSMSKVIAPLISRWLVFDFQIPVTERPAISMAMFKRVCTILDTEGISYEKKVVAELIGKFFPDFRRTLNEIQRYSACGKIDSGILLNASRASYQELVKCLAAKDYKAMRKWVGENSDGDSSLVFKDFYENAFSYFEPACVPTLVLLMADYGFKATHAVDQQINLAAFLTEVMISGQFKE